MRQPVWTRYADANSCPGMHPRPESALPSRFPGRQADSEALPRSRSGYLQQAQAPRAAARSPGAQASCSAWLPSGSLEPVGSMRRSGASTATPAATVFAAGMAGCRPGLVARAGPDASVWSQPSRRPSTTPRSVSLGGMSPDPRRCPLCGQANQCGMAGTQGAPCASAVATEDCWCFRATIPQSVLDQVPAAARGVACVCAACAAGGDRPVVSG